MPRPHSHPHILRDLRATIGLSQAELAERVGVSAIAIQRIEGGSLALSSQLASRIMLATGISGGELLRGGNGKLIDALGRPYSAETFRWWKIKKMVGADRAKEDAENLGWWVEVLLKAAGRAKEGNRYFAARDALINSLTTIRDEFGLGKLVDVILSEHAPKVEWRPGWHRPEDIAAIEKELADASLEAVEERRGKRMKALSEAIPQKPHQLPPAPRAKARR
jgi:transcriptional regulator with XRE-family HTH domain